jgi:hypothetical protein
MCTCTRWSGWAWCGDAKGRLQRRFARALHHHLHTLGQQVGQRGDQQVQTLLGPVKPAHHHQQQGVVVARQAQLGLQRTPAGLLALQVGGVVGVVASARVARRVPHASSSIPLRMPLTLWPSRARITPSSPKPNSCVAISRA